MKLRQRLALAATLVFASLNVTANDLAYVTLEDIDPTAGMGLDDTEILHAAAAKAFRERKTLMLLGKNYLFEQPVKLDFHTLHITSAGGNVNRYNLSGAHGTVLTSTVTQGTAFSFAGHQNRIENLTFITETSGVALRTSQIFKTVLKDITLMTTNAGIGLQITKSFTNRYEDINVINMARDRTGKGFVFHDKNETLTGGNVLMDNITVEYYDINIEFGHADPSQKAKRRWKRNNRYTRLQSRYAGRFGIRIGSGVGRTQLVNPWAEESAGIALHIHSGAGPITVEGGEFRSRSTNTPTIFLGGGNRDGIAHTTFRDTYIQGTPVAAVRVVADSSAPASRYHEFDGVDFDTRRGGPAFKMGGGTQVDVLIKRPVEPFTQQHPNLIEYQVQ